jgi:formamidase
MGKGLRYAAKVSLDKPASEQECLHVRYSRLWDFHLWYPYWLAQNRWHPENPSYGTIKPNEVVKIECVDWTGGQIGNNDSADDMRDVDLTKIHYLTGPFDIETAEPGDVLVVEIQDVQPLDEQPWGFTGNSQLQQMTSYGLWLKKKKGVFAKENGGGFLDEIYPEP